MKTRKKPQRAIIYNPVWTPEGTRDRLRCVENASHGLRVVGKSHDILPRHRHTGWYVDLFDYSETVCGVVLQLPARNGSPCYVPAVTDPNNDDCYYAAFDDTTDDKEDCARTADGLAEAYAEREREYQIKASAELDIETAHKEIAKLRAQHRDTVQELRSVARAMPASDAPRLCAAIRRDLARMRDSVREEVKRIRKLTEDPSALLY